MSLVQKPKKTQHHFDEKMSGFNVRDDLKDLTVEQIKEAISSTALPGAVAMMNLQGDFNFSSVVRNANAFGIVKVFYCGGKRHWDRRGAVGTHHYIDVKHCPTLEDLIELTKDYTWIALENNTDYTCESIYDFSWPSKPMVIIGEEGEGLSNEILNLCNRVVSIPQYGSVRSINAATASGIAMNSYAQSIKGKRK